MDFKILLEKITPVLKYIARKHLLYGFYDEKDLFQEMCIYLWEHYRNGLPIGINESYVIKGCEFHIQNFLRKGRPKAKLSSLDELVSPGNLRLSDILEDKKEIFSERSKNKLTIDEIKNLKLTDGERSVLSGLLKGYTIREIAKTLGVSHVMILKHKKNIIKKWHKKRLPDN